ncbi:rho GTPase-activating protein 6 isoform X2 [Engraulis encrasicolus]|uniref:rho GTPase-activating protein 6 isoform X2 n=1 Tax=Engraulis encrasicolus TaxID=184585 RepID=UPI002FCF150D
MSAHGLLNVFSCSSSASKYTTKRKLRQTRSLDPALIRNDGTDSNGLPGYPVEAKLHYFASQTGGLSSLQASSENLTASPAVSRAKTARVKAHHSSSSLFPSSESSSLFDFGSDYEGKTLKRSVGDLTLLRSSTPTGCSSTLFSPRKWLQKKQHHQNTPSYTVYHSEGDFTWSSASGRSVCLQPSPIQSLSELERVRLQEVAFCQLTQDYDLACQITIPKDCQKRKKSLRKKFDSIAKEKSKDKEFVPQAFGMPLLQVIANDRAHKQRHDGHRGEEHRDTSTATTTTSSSSSDLFSSILPFTSKRPNKELSSSNSSLSSTSESPSDGTSVTPGTPEAGPRARRRGGMSVDCITDLDDSDSRLLEALQLSLPAEPPSKKEKQRDKKLSLNPIYRQVPRVVDCCCQHLERFGLQTVGIFRVGSSKKRVRQLREEFDQGIDVQLEEEHSVHDVAALLKEFLRDMPDPLLTKELYTAFINCMSLDPAEQTSCMQLLLYLLPACNCDTLHRLLEFLATVAAHADDSHSTDGHEVPGNKMTSLNLATIFGPNLLHKQKSSDKEFVVQSSARAEESTTIIGIVQRMINTYEALFTVSPELQHEVLMSLLETDPDVVDYLLRRKAAQSESPGPLRSEDSLSLSERHSCSDSNVASSGEVSPYDNNSPVLSDQLLLPPELCEDNSSGSSRLPNKPDKLFLEGPVRGRLGHPSHTAAASGTAKNEDAQSYLWGTWHASLKTGLKDHNSGSQGNVSQSSLGGSSEGLDSQQQRVCAKPPLRRLLTSQALAELRTHHHAPLTRASSSPQSGAWPSPAPSPVPGQPMCSSHHETRSQPASGSLDDIRGRTARPPHTARATCGGRPESRPSYLYSAQCRSNAAPPPSPLSLSSTHSPSSPSTLSPLNNNNTPGPQTEASGSPSTPRGHNGPSTDSPEWQQEKWQIWQLLSTDNADTFPETLV